MITLLVLFLSEGGAREGVILGALFSDTISQWVMLIMLLNGVGK